MITVPWWFTIINDATDDFRRGAYKDYGIERNALKIQREANKYRFKDTTVTLFGSEVRATKILSNDEIPEELRLESGEIKTWFRCEREHIAKALFKEAGYVVARHWAEMNDVELDVKPCEGADHQCHMDCSWFGKCEQWLEGSVADYGF